ncbi:MAG: 23S rRNA (adenine(2503)-C(2))-methyltransferase RlmN, partial [bacterium]
QVSADDTKKYLFSALQGKFIEAAYIPGNDRSTLCLSTQVGCKMGCFFCMTAKQGFQGNLSTGEILNQFKMLPERDKLTNLVYMGMGEPFDNPEAVMNSLEILTSEEGFGWSPKRITVSTIGIIPAMKNFLEKSKCHLAVSLHSPFDEERRRLMPIQRSYPVKEVIETIKNYDLGKQRRVSFEYIMFKNLNDTERHVNELAKLLNGVRCRINLLRFHPVPGSNFSSPEESVIQKFKDSLNKKGILTTVRVSRGQDIDAACGLLSTLKYRDNN